MLLLPLLRRLRLLRPAHLPLSMACPEWSLHSHRLVWCHCLTRLQLLGLRLMRPRHPPRHARLRRHRRQVRRLSRPRPLLLGRRLVRRLHRPCPHLLGLAWCGVCAIIACYCWFIASLGAIPASGIDYAGSITCARCDCFIFVLC
jgi:hypothetical protein